MRVIVAHPGLQHAHQLAWGLEEAGYLDHFYSGIPVGNGQSRPDVHHSLCGVRMRTAPIPADKLSRAILFPLLCRASSLLLPSASANALNHRLDNAYDAWIARSVRKRSPDIVVCYENSALRCFREARSAGAVCVLDAASVHYSAGEKWGDRAVGQNPAWIDDRKRHEIELADAILTCSELAAATYREAGIANEKVFAIPLGTEFPAARRLEQSGQSRFVFAGTSSSRKGVDLLLDVFSELEREGVQATLTLIGGFADRKLAARAKLLGNVRMIGFLDQAKLFSELVSHDCLVLPSRFDSFGMVVPEALAVGLPVIVSNRVGAKCIIEQHPDAGWIVECDAQALHARIRELARQPALLASASAATAEAARDYSWQAYRLRVVRALESIYKTSRKTRVRP